MQVVNDLGLTVDSGRIFLPIKQMVIVAAFAKVFQSCLNFVGLNERLRP